MCQLRLGIATRSGGFPVLAADAEVLSAKMLTIPSVVSTHSEHNPASAHPEEKRLAREEKRRACGLPPLATRGACPLSALPPWRARVELALPPWRARVELALPPWRARVELAPWRVRTDLCPSGGCTCSGVYDEGKFAAGMQAEVRVVSTLGCGAGNILIGRGEGGAAQLTLLDHGAYCVPGEAFRRDYCELWAKLLQGRLRGAGAVQGDVEGMRGCCRGGGLSLELEAAVSLSRARGGGLSLEPQAAVSPRAEAEVSLLSLELEAAVSL
ncbi:hypothetical protein CYMTET_22860 [Cymbomonas tetramitiformis]|uniref:Uncharacterized protein n=1 Tax=Cymbomonas tetramitiformis TaxID=36881 RepID=A0AAE0FZI3_9CHLO|nr:hypothetical protein CYMTET_22860 [Cymbomonas tetramitiformis]